MLHRWMEQPHWREWWGEPEGELDNIRSMIEGKDTSRPFLFFVDGKPTGYIQYWFLGHHQNASWIAGYPWLAEFPVEAIGIDLSIGESTDLSVGIGSNVLSKFTQILRSIGYETIIIDPDPENARAIRAYEKAGFKIVSHLKDKSEDVLLMQYEPKLVRNSK